MKIVVKKHVLDRLHQYFPSERRRDARRKVKQEIINGEEVSFHHLDMFGFKVWWRDHFIRFENRVYVVKIYPEKAKAKKSMVAVTLLRKLTEIEVEYFEDHPAARVSSKYSL